MILITWFAIKKVASFSHFIILKYDKRWLYTLPCVSWLFTQNVNQIFTTRRFCLFKSVWILNRPFCLYSDLSSVYLTDCAVSRHSLHGKPTSLDKAATSRFTAIMSQQMIFYPIFLSYAIAFSKLMIFIEKSTICGKTHWSFLFYYAFK